jgi:hypothetical protein
MTTIESVPVKLNSHATLKNLLLPPDASSINRKSAEFPLDRHNEHRASQKKRWKAFLFAFSALARFVPLQFE